MIKILPMGRKKLNRKPLNITVPNDMRDQIHAQAEHEGRTVSDIVTELLRDYLAKLTPPPKPPKRRR